MKKVLITGASGFIGSFLVEEALKEGYDVYAGIRESSNLRYLTNPKINYVYIDFSNKESLKKQLVKIDKFDFIIHCAGVTKTCNKKLFDIVNYQYTKNLIDALLETSKVPEKFIFVSSLAAYGPGQKDVEPIKLTDTPKPVSYYGKSKLKTEQYIKSLKDFPYLIFRPTGVYGPREKDYYVMYKSIKQGIETYINTKKQLISFIYVKDLSRLIVGALNSEIINKSYFVSDLKEYTAQEFNWLIKKKLIKKTISLVFPGFLVKILAFINEKVSCLFSSKIPTLNTEKFKEISQKNWLCDSSALVKDFNFKPEYNLSKGLDETLQWYKKENLL
ncbi:MAG: NAD(P)-dependent oxidoreductase [Bacteroidetes bacterium]|nr:MAG: NAD(P)-dependent oxidoreductase [Bacteroidota bacterium]